MGIWEQMPDTFLDKLRRRVRIRPTARARLEHRRLDPGHARRQGRRLLRAGRQLRRRHSRHRRDRGRAGDVRAHRPRRHQAQPLAPLPRARRRCCCPASAGPSATTQATGEQFVTVEDSMAMVHRSRRPPAAHLARRSQRGRDRHRAWRRSCSATRSAGGRWGATTASSASTSSTWSRGFTPTRSGWRGRAGSCCRGAHMTRAPSPPRPARRASRSTRRPRREVPEGHLLLQTVRSHDQFNTTVYGLDDRYRGHQRRSPGGVRQPRRPRATATCADGDLVDLVSVWSDGERRAPSFRVVEYPTPRGLCRHLLPRGERPGPARFDRGDQQHAGIQVDRDPVGALGRPHQLGRPPGISTGAATQGSAHPISARVSALRGPLATRGAGAMRAVAGS